jgi:DHA1 family bicyclomycin/chloramphenicol resistance-like MFS transporter
MAAITVTALLLEGLAGVGWLGAWQLVPLAVIGFIGQGIVRPNAVQGALEPMPDIAGVASAVLSTSQMAAGALSSALVAELFDGRSAVAMTGMMAVTACGAATAYAAIVGAPQRRRGAGAEVGAPTRRSA